MRFMFKTALGIVLVAGLIATAGAEETAVPSSLHVPVEKSDWQKTPFGPTVTSVAGDFTRGKHLTLIRFPAGLKSPLHIHSHDYSGVVVTGQGKHFEPGKPETEVVLGPGSHWFIKGGVPHVSECLSGAECIFAIEQDEAFDFVATQ